MSFGYASQRTTASKAVPTFETYQRPSEWLALTPVGASEQKVTGLVAIMPDNGSNLLAVLCQGNYTVDWGDGSVTNHTASTQALHQYDYAAVGNLTSYGYKQVIVTITPQAGQNLTQVNLRQKPSTVGSAITWCNRWLDVEVGSPNLTSMTIGGNNGIASFMMMERFRWVSKSASYTSFLDFFYYCTALQEIIIDANFSNVTSMAAFFYGCTSLKYGPYMDTSSLTDASNMFGLCSNLVSVPDYDFSKVTTMASTFNGCSRLQTVQLKNLANVTAFGTVFTNCYELKNLPALDLPKATTMGQTFSGCRSLETITITNAGNCNSFVNMFNGCSSLVSASITGTNVNANNINMSGMFVSCPSLTEVTLLDTAKSNNMSQMFGGCNSLETFPTLDTSNNVNFSQMFISCVALIDPPNLVTTKGNTFASMFQGCYELTSAPNYNLANANNVAGMYTGCGAINTLPNYNLSNVTSGGGSIITTGAGLTNSTPLISSNVTGLRFTTTYVSCGIDKGNLESIFNNLGSVGGVGQNINISSNPGADTALSKTATWTNTSNVITMANTVGVTVGTQVTGANIGNAIAVTITSNNKISTTNMIDNNTFVAFANVQTSNLTANTLYWVSNQANVTGTYFYDISTSNGGSPITFTSGTGNLNINRIVTNVNTNANITISAYPSGNGTAAAATTRVLNTNIAAFKGFTITG